MVINALDYLTSIDEGMEQYKNEDGLWTQTNYLPNPLKKKAWRISRIIYLSKLTIKMSYHPEEIIK